MMKEVEPTMSTTEQQAFSHVVYFTLKEKTDAMRASLVDGCNKYLSDHPGTIHYSAGCRALDYQRPVNDQEFDVALVAVFASEADHDAYQISDRHQQFLAEFKDSWAQVRVFDAFV